MARLSWHRMLLYIQSLFNWIIFIYCIFFSKITEWTTNPDHIIEGLDNIERTVHCENSFRLSVLFSFLFAWLSVLLLFAFLFSWDFAWYMVLYANHIINWKTRNSYILHFREQKARASLQSGSHVFRAILCYGRSHCSIQWDDHQVCSCCFLPLPFDIFFEQNLSICTLRYTHCLDIPTNC